MLGKYQNLKIVGKQLLLQYRVQGYNKFVIIEENCMMTKWLGDRICYEMNVFTSKFIWYSDQLLGEMGCHHTLFICYCQAPGPCPGWFLVG